MGLLLPLVRKNLTVGLEIMESSDKSDAACVCIRFWCQLLLKKSCWEMKL